MEDEKGAKRTRGRRSIYVKVTRSWNRKVLGKHWWKTLGFFQHNFPPPTARGMRSEQLGMILEQMWGAEPPQPCCAPPWCRSYLSGGPVAMAQSLFCSHTINFGAARTTPTHCETSPAPWKGLWELALDPLLLLPFHWFEDATNEINYVLLHGTGGWAWGACPHLSLFI